ncbi:MAG: hypothetical protein JRN52_13395 [Nitrososphaerota archaeon]|nr:hypothetical protein [Nitrososphaerota archaeon]
MLSWFQRLDGLRPNFRVCVYGHYHPDSELGLLERVCNALREGSSAYPQTYLVRDLPDRTQFSGDNYLKSIFAIQQSHANLLILTFAGSSQGVLRELGYVIQNNEFVPKSTVFIETDYSSNGSTLRRATTSLLDEDLKALNFRVVHFRKGDLNDLVTQAKGTVTNLFYYYIKNRSADLNMARLI